MYVLRSPSPTLNEWIEHYWFVRDVAGESVDLRVEVFVDARADLIFNFGVPYRRRVIGGTEAEVGDSNLDAQRLFPIRIEQHGAVRVCGVRFRLGGVAPFTSAHLADFSGATAPPVQVFGEGVRRLEEEFRDATDPDAATELLDGLFLDLLSRHGPHAAFVRGLRALSDSDGRAGFGEVAAAAAASPRHVERLFARELGFTPKTVARVLRFQGALRALMDDPGVALAELAASAGYFDQAHFVKDFRRFTGGVPRGYRGYYPPDGPTDFAPNVVVFLQDDVVVGGAD